jgi:hypothetical protein
VRAGRWVGVVVVEIIQLGICGGGKEVVGWCWNEHGSTCTTITHQSGAKRRWRGIQTRRGQQLHGQQSLVFVVQNVQNAVNNANGHCQCNRAARACEFYQVCPPILVVFVPGWG